MSDALARRLASAALGVALLALTISLWAVHLGYRYLDDVQRLGQTMQTLLRDRGSGAMPLNPPPLTLDTGEE
ncbi:MAG: hypothetical protein GXP55_05710 [Deltaproteobacteria bacterium]|nr:hypothetical protein [Deltaproteobacteria bacterium]